MFNSPLLSQRFITPSRALICSKIFKTRINFIIKRKFIAGIPFSFSSSSLLAMSGKNSLARDSSLFNTYNYGEVGYWDSRYSQEVRPFDWYQRYQDLKPFINAFVPKDGRVLMVGCGNAVISEEMVLDGYEEIVNIDLSTVVIGMMQKKYESIPQLKYIHMDARDMSYFPNDLFDSVIDKGTLDSLMCGISAPVCAARMLEEVSRFSSVLAWDI
eukprot:TRINITY_DN3443_c0_g1_i2.p1 TRINITY_DN3443_c0_g1~~TRINITY_DN3443_c0_g1_i2.p1  ORF type:complete len:214 (+),score=17.39 TRINITY_DN3443_c0_g1_i2:284-925(+)